MMRIVLGVQAAYLASATTVSTTPSVSALSDYFLSFLFVPLFL